MKELHKTVVREPKQQDQISLKKHYFENDKNTLEDFINKIKGDLSFSPGNGSESLSPKFNLIHL
jgi:hypothetical protein